MFGKFVFISAFLILGSKISQIFSGNESYKKPEQIRIAFGESTNSIVVTWTTFNNTSESKVEYGVNNLERACHMASGSSVMFIDGGDAKSFQFIHRVSLTGLEYDTTYVYKVGSEEGWSEEYTFHIPPQDTNDWVLKAAIFGDLGLTSGFALPYLIKDTQQSLYDVMIHNGDIAYEMADYDGTTGDKFLRGIEPVAANIPYMVSVGNHEHNFNFSHYAQKFSMPNYQNTQSYFYSYNIGKVHFIGFSSEHYYHPDLKLGEQAQNNWLIQDLEEATKEENRKKYPWIIAYAHKPMYCSNTDDECKYGNGFHKIKELEPLFNKYGIDIAFWAHEHTYERTWPMYDWKVYNGSEEKPYVNPKAPIHIVSGNAGAKISEDHFKDIINPWSAFRANGFGYTKLWAYNATHIHIQQIDTPKDGTSASTVIDDFWIVQDKHGPFNL